MKKCKWIVCIFWYIFYFIVKFILIGKKNFRIIVYFIWFFDMFLGEYYELMDEEVLEDK